MWCCQGVARAIGAMRQGLAYEQLCDVETEAARMLQGATACQVGIRSNRKPGVNRKKLSVVRDSEGHSVIFMVISTHDGHVFQLTPGFLFVRRPTCLCIAAPN